MRKLVIFLLLLFASPTVLALSNKDQAIDAVKQFFNINKQKQVFNGHFSETDAQYGRFCQVIIDFSRPGKEYLTIVGEFAPVGYTGDGVYFNENEQTFVDVQRTDDLLTLEQKLSDSFSTGTKTWLVLTKNKNTLRFSLYQQIRFMLFTDVVEKKCIIENYTNN